MKSYLSEFRQYAQSSLDDIYWGKRMTRYALTLNLKANKLLRLATLNKVLNLPKLQTEMFEMGRDYVRKFGLLIMPKQKKPGKTG